MLVSKMKIIGGRVKMKDAGFVRLPNGATLTETGTKGTFIYEGEDGSKIEIQNYGTSGGTFNTFPSDVRTMIYNAIKQFSTDSKTKDESLDEKIRKMAREKADAPLNDDGTIRTPQQAQLAYEQWYKIIKSRYKNDSRYAAEYTDSKTKDEKIISIATPQWEGDIKIIDGTHFEMKAKGTDRWSWALHIGQADDHILNALKAKGVLKDNGRFFATDSKIKDVNYESKLKELKGKLLEQRTGGATAIEVRNTLEEIQEVENVMRNSPNKDSFTGIDSIKVELKEAEADLARAKAKGDANWIREASGYVNELKKELASWGKNNDAIDPTKPKNIAAAKNLSVAQGKAASDGGPGERLINFAETDYVR